MQLKKQIEELVRTGKLSHLIKEIKHGRDQSKTGKKETSAKDKPTAIYMIQSWQRTTRQKVTQSFKRVKAIAFLPLAASSGTEGPLVIEVEMGGHMIHRMYVDGGSLMEILYEHCFNRLRPEIKSQMVPATTSLTGFSGKTIWLLGQLRLLVIVGDANHSTRAWMNFMVVRLLSPYNGIIGRPGIRKIQAVPSTTHGMLKFLIERRIVTIRSTILIPTECTSVITSSVVSKEKRTRPDNFKVALYPDFPNQEKPSDLTGVLQSVAEHRLNIREGYSPVRQKKRGQAPERAKAIQVEVQKLVEAGIMREVYYHDWLSNPVMAKKHDVFLGRLQRLPPDTVGRTKRRENSFPHWTRVYCYTKMPFGLKNAGATYQRLMDKAFESQIGQNIEVYVDDLVVKSYTEAEMLRDIEKTFRTPRTSVKGQILVDFLIEMSDENPQAAPVTETQQEPWTLFTDGSSCVDGSGAGLILTNPEGIEFTYALRFQFAASNNEAEYEALIAGLRISAQMGVKNVHVSVDSKLVANQILGTYVSKEDNMVKHLDKVKSLEGGKKAPHQGPTVRVIGGNSLQVVVPYAMVKMCWTAPGGIHRAITRSPQQPLTPITAPWPFYKWGIDIAGPFPKGPGKVKFLIVTMDYFTKWIEAKAVATITGGQVKKFVWDNIVCHFGLQGEIVSDNSKQFSHNPFKDWCDKLNITQRFASVKHPQSNGLVERANRSLGEGIKAHLAVIPTEIGMPTYRTAAVDVVSNDEELRLNLELLEERGKRAVICEAKAKSKMTKYYNARVRGVTFRPGDFVYRSNDTSHTVAGGKLGPKWEGPYEVTDALGDGAYKLRSMDRTILPMT
nr:reverse transcriptase domain-containing protein [Tanacetum cinerariifolium]